MNNLIKPTDDNYKKMILNQTIFLDLRSEGEFLKSSLPCSINIPILNDEDRHLVGLEYKKNGNESAIKLGNSLVSGEKKEKLLNLWKKTVDENKDIVLMCHRGGQRSKIAQDWLLKEGYDVQRLEKGYKAFRNYLIDALNPKNITVPSLIISGNTGSGKTLLIKKLSMSIDLEELALHRGSAFGGRITPQPSQATFENSLAFELIKKQSENPEFIAFESESKGIGKVNIPNDFFEYMHTAPYVFVNSDMDERVEFTYLDYVVNDLMEYEKHFGEKGKKLWETDLRDKLIKLEKKLGQDRLSHCLSIFDKASEEGNFLIHKKWILYLLKEYYDPMYEHHRKRWCDKIVKTANIDDMYFFLENHSFDEIKNSTK